jgi:hypothetical protein
VSDTQAREHLGVRFVITLYCDDSDFHEVRTENLRNH